MLFLDFSSFPRLLALVFAAWAWFTPVMVWAQSAFPNRPITVVIPFGPGGETDIFARALSADLGEVLGQPIVVVNRPGATGVVASESVARSNPDGYTLLFGTAATHALNVAVFKKLPYDPQKDFEPIAFVGSVPLVLLTSLSMPANARDFIALLKGSPDKFFYGSAGVSTSYLGIELFKNAAGISARNVPYKGTGESIQGLLGDQVQFIGGSLGAAQALVKAGKLRALAVMSPRRLAAAPEIPTLAEAASLPLDVGTWNVIVAPAGTPKPILERLNAAVNEVLRRPGVVERLYRLGISPVADSTPASTSQVIGSEITKWREAFKLAGLQPE
jgi:tripartite-type tricarboxylate transporter receptor subunit TctC